MTNKQPGLRVVVSPDAETLTITVPLRPQGLSKDQVVLYASRGFVETGKSTLNGKILVSLNVIAVK